VCEGERGKRDGKLALSINLTTTAYHCHRCKLSGYLDREAAELAGKARAVLAGEQVLESDINESLNHWFTATTSVRRRSLVNDSLRGLFPDIEQIESSRHLSLSHPEVVAFVGEKLHAIAFLICGPEETTIPAVAGLIRDRHQHTTGKLKGWVLRSFQNRGPKYQNCPLMLRAACFFNEQAVYKPTSEPLVVVEGCFDALSRFPNGVAVLGSLSQWQRERLLLAPRPVLIVPDGDAWEAGRMDAMELAHYGQTAGFLRLPAGKDPDEFSNKEWSAMVREKAEWF
jgi:hypothetical protein